MAGSELQASLNRLAGTTGLDSPGAANVIAGTVGLDLLGALNRKAGTTGLELNGVCKALATAYNGNTGLDAQGALDSITGFGGGAIGAALNGRGHSYMAGTAASSQANRYIEKVGVAISSSGVTNSGVGGSKGLHVYSAALPGNSKARTVDANGLVVWDAIINEIVTTAFADDAQNQRRSAASVRSFIRLMQASAVTPFTDGSVSFTGTWSTVAGLNYDGINNLDTKRSSTVGDKIEIAGYTGSKISIGMLDFETTGPKFTVGIGGVVYGTFDRTLGYGTDNLYGENLVNVDLPAGTKTVEIIILTGASQPLYFTRYVTPSATPPSILLVKDPPLNVYTGAGGNYTAPQGLATLTAMNATLDTIAAETEFGGTSYVRTCDPSVGWDPATMIDADTLHPNNAGHTQIATVASAAALLFPARSGLT
jgi:hypothetical protein